MDEYTFLKEKERVVNYAREQLSKPGLTKENEEALTILLGQINKYTYQNRDSIKGLMIRTIIDSLPLNTSLFDRFFHFDELVRRSLK